MPQEQKVNPSDTCFKHEWHWTVLDICPIPVQLDVAHFVNYAIDSSLNFKELSGFPRSSRIDFVREPFLDFPTTPWICPIRSSSFKITSCANPSILTSTLH